MRCLTIGKTKGETFFCLEATQNYNVLAMKTEKQLT